MSFAKEPRSLRFEAAINSVENNRGRNPGRKISMAASLRAALFSVSYATLGIVATTETWAQTTTAQQGQGASQLPRFRSPLPKRGATPTRRPPSGRTAPDRAAVASRASP
jgi:hypothetical protein